MKKLLILSMFALGTITANASNDLFKNYYTKDLNEINLQLEKSDNDGISGFTYTYKVDAWHYFYDPITGNGSSYGTNITPQTPCYNESQINVYMQMAQAMYGSQNTPYNYVIVKKEIVSPCAIFNPS